MNFSQWCGRVIDDARRHPIVVLMALVVVVLVVGGFGVMYDARFDTGFDAGYRQGYNEGVMDTEVITREPEELSPESPSQNGHSPKLVPPPRVPSETASPSDDELFIP